MALTAKVERLKLALFPGFVTGFDEIGANIRTTLAEINDEAMYGLHREVNLSGKQQEYLKDRADKAELAHQKLLAQNSELLAQNESLKAELEKQRLKFEHRDKQETERRLRAFSDFLEGMMHLSSMITELKGSPVSVKLLVIAETSEGNAEWHNEWLPRFKFDLERLIVRHDWDQQQLPSWLSTTDSRPQIWGSGSAPSVTTF
ncbi:hypothetical protein DL765_005194 [Monosporascus sp. GIB2]|nr:hypothetical protein DL765_005194 [Monosporascus sp. GIB2]